MKSLNPFSRRERISGNLIESTWCVIFAGYGRVEGRCKNYGWTLIPNTKWNYSRSEHVKINCQIAKIVWKFDMPTKAARWKYNLRNAEKLYDFSRNSKLFLRISFGTRMTRINSQSAASGLPDRREKGTLGIADGSWPSTAFFVISVLRAWFVVQPQAAVAVPATGVVGGEGGGQEKIVDIRFCRHLNTSFVGWQLALISIKFKEIYSLREAFFQKMTRTSRDTHFAKLCYRFWSIYLNRDRKNRSN